MTNYPALCLKCFLVEVDDRWNTNVLKKAEEITEGVSLLIFVVSFEFLTKGMLLPSIPG